MFCSALFCREILSPEINIFCSALFEEILSTGIKIFCLALFEEILSPGIKILCSACFEEILSLSWNWDYIMNISESDLPVKPIQQFENHLRY